MTDNIQEKIAKLLAKARGTDNEAEAAIFMAKAQEMLAEHNLTEAQLRSRDSRASEPVGEHKYRDSVAKWRLTIAMGCAKLYFCTLLTYGKELRFVGKAHNAEVAMSMTDWLCAVVKRMAREYSSDRRIQGDFYKGASLRLYSRLLALYEEQNPKTPTPESKSKTPGTSLVVLYQNEEADVRGYLETLKVRTKRSRPMSYGMAGAAGAAAANGISLNTQVTGRASRRIGNG